MAGTIYLLYYWPFSFIHTRFAVQISSVLPRNGFFIFVRLPRRFPVPLESALTIPVRFTQRPALWRSTTHLELVIFPVPILTILTCDFGTIERSRQIPRRQMYSFVPLKHPTIGCSMIKPGILDDYPNSERLVEEESTITACDRFVNLLMCAVYLPPK